MQDDQDMQTMTIFEAGELLDAVEVAVLGVASGESGMESFLWGLVDNLDEDQRTDLTLHAVLLITTSIRMMGWSLNSMGQQAMIDAVLDFKQMFLERGMEFGQIVREVS